MNKMLDIIDKKLLRELQRNGRLSVVDLAARVNLTKTPCSERVKRLENTGVIAGYNAQIDPDKVEQSHLTIVHVNMMKTIDDSLEDFNTAVKKIPEVQSCFMIAGSFDYMLKVRTRDIAQYREVLGLKISKLPNVRQTHSFSVLETVKDNNFVEVTC